MEIVAQVILGIVLGIPLLIILIRGIDKICIWLFDRYRNEVFSSIKISELTDKQKSALKEGLYKANHNSDRWYEANMDCVDRLSSGKELNLLEMHRLANGLSWFPYLFEDAEDKPVYEKVRKALWSEIPKLEQKVEEIKRHEKLVAELDVASKQIQIAKWSAVAAGASAIASIAVACVAYLQFTNYAG